MAVENILGPPVRIALVVARAENGVIGRDGKLPWHISAELQYFKRLTLGKPVIMGRKTYESIGRPLPRRTNIVVTRDRHWQAAGLAVAPDLPTAFALAYEDAHRTGADEIMVIGGADIYRQALDRADRVYLTEVHSVFEGDTVLELDLSSNWREGSRERHRADSVGGPEFSFVILDRVPVTASELG
ncbi:MAG: dihydrofolate reductase [Rhodospirillaceae bacterium]|nr:dihydrofolate reductase [Rhodospirillaceae bacterium]